MNNFKILLVQELSAQMKTFTFVIMLPTAIIISLLVTNLQLTSYKDRQEVFQEQQLKSTESLENVYFYSQLKVDVYMPPSILSIFSKGLDENIGNKVTISALDQPEIESTSQRGNAFIKIFNNIDISGIIKIVSIFIVLMAACPIAQDKEHQMGKLIFANSIGKLEYFLSKYSAMMIIACIIVFIIFAIPMVWIILDPPIELTGSLFGSILLIMLASLLYLSIFVLMSLMISSISSKMAIATLFSLIIWVTLSYIYPYTVNSFIDRLISVPSENSIMQQIEEIDKKIVIDNIEFMKETDNIVNRGWCLLSIGSSPAGIVMEYGTATKSYFDKARSILDYTLPTWWKRIDEVSEIKENQKKQMLYKKTLFDRISFFVPDRIYKNLCEQTAATDYGSREKRFISSVKKYRPILMNYIQSKNGFGYAFFTQVPGSEMRENYEDYPSDFEDKYCRNMQPLNLSDMPQFQLFQESEMNFSWIGLLLLNLIVGVLSVVFYFKYTSFK